MHMTQCNIAISRGINQDTESDEVVNLADICRCLEMFKILKLTGAACNFPIETISMFHTPRDFCFDSDRSHLRSQNATDAVDIRSPLLALHFDDIAYPLILLTPYTLNAQILPFPFTTRPPHS